MRAVFEGHRGHQKLEIVSTAHREEKAHDCHRLRASGVHNYNSSIESLVSGLVERSNWSSEIGFFQWDGCRMETQRDVDSAFLPL